PNQTYNSYILTIEQRQKLIYHHPIIPTKYPPKIKQFITPSLPFHHFQSPLTFFSHHLLQFKKILYQIPFHQTTPPYPQFPTFFLPHLINTNQFHQFFPIS
ncbi:chlorite dismutase family protein, partial [Staphylococcus aureus]|uniref:chlorite dismutase family protein n=1 Tax=Staphylococcus aureus TaxID=1280 RepID=UPI0016432805